MLKAPWRGFLRLRGLTRRSMKPILKALRLYRDGASWHRIQTSSRRDLKTSDARSMSALPIGAPRVEEEIKNVITYLNDEVVPQVRQNSSQALRIAAEHLARLAEHLDKRP